MRVDARHHGSPLLRLPRQFGEVRVLGVRLVPPRQFGDFSKRPVRDLSGEQAEERLLRLVVVLRLFADKVEGGESVAVVAIGGGRVLRVVVIGGVGGIRGIADERLHGIRDQLDAADGPGLGRCTPERRLEEGMGPYMMKLRKHVLVAVRGRQRLDVVDRGIRLVGRSAIAPFSPVSRDITGGRQRLTHTDVVGAHGLLRVIPVIAIPKRVPLMERGLLRGPGRRANGAAIGTPEIDAAGGEFVEVGGLDESFVGRLACRLPVRTDGSPPHVVYIEVEDVGPRRGLGLERGDKDSKTCQNKQRVFHVITFGPGFPR